MTVEPRLVIHGESGSSVRASNEAREALAKLRAEASAGSKTITASAREVVAAQAKEHEALKRQASAFREVAATAAKGSREQVTAARLAAEAEKKLAGAYAEVAHEQARATSAHAGGRSELDKATRGALVGTGAFRSLGRSIAFASATFLGTAGFVKVVSDSVTGASDLREQIEKTNDVFRASGPQVVTWSKGLATSFGIAQREALAFTSTFGNMLVPMGVAPAKAADMSKHLVELSADVAAFNNLPIAEVLEKMRAGLAGMPRPLRTVGVFLDQTRIKAEAVADGFVKATADGQKIADAETRLSIAHAKLTATQAKYGAGTTQVASATVALHTAQAALEKAVAGNVPPLDAQAKAMAAYQIIVKDTAIQQGNFRKTSGDLAQQQKILHAEVGNLEDELGAQLLPTVTRVTTAVTAWLGKSENQERIQRDLHEATQAVTDAVREAWPQVKSAAHWANEAANAMGGWNNVIKIYLGYKLATKLADAATNAATLATRLGALSKLKVGPIQIGVALVGSALALKALDKFLGGKTGFSTQTGANAAGQETFRTRVGGPGSQPKYGADVVFAGTTGSGSLTYYLFVDPASGQIYISPKRRPSPQDISPVDNTKDIPASVMRRARAIAAKYKATAPVVPPTAALTSGKSVQIPESFTPTHETAGLAGFPAVDIMATPGTGIGAPEDGMITRISGNEPMSPPPQGPGGPWGLSIYFVGNETGNTYYMTHLLKVAAPGHYRKGDIIGIIGNYPGRPSHVHLGIHRGDSAEAHYGSGLFKPSDYLAKPSVATATTTSAADAGRGADKGPASSSKPLRVAVTKAPPSVRAQLDAAFGIAVAKAERTTKVSDDLHVIAAELRWIDSRLADKGLSAADRLDLEQTKTDLINAARDLEKGQHDKQKAAAAKLAAAFKAQQDAPAPSHAALVRAAGVFRGGDVGAVGVTASRAAIDRIGTTQAAIAKKSRAEYKKMMDGIQKDLRAGLKQSDKMWNSVGDILSRALERAKKIAAAKAKDLAAALTFATPVGAELAKLPGATQLTVGSDLFGRPLQMSVAKAKDRVAELVQVVKTGSAKARAAAIEELSKIADGVSAALSDATAKAQATLDAATQKFQQMFERVAARVLGAFDRDTQRGIDQMNKAAQAQIDVLSKAAQASIDTLTSANQAHVKMMQEDLKKQVDAVSAATDTAIAQLQTRADARIKQIQDRYSAAIQAAQIGGQALTPAEKALQDLQEQHDATQRAVELAAAQKALADAKQTGDPEQIKAAQDALNEILYQEKIRQLQKEADAERKALDDETAAKVKALEDQQAAAEKQVQDELAARQKAIQDEAATRTAALQQEESDREEVLAKLLQDQVDAINGELATRTAAIQAETTTQIQGYQDERDAQRAILEDQLTDWETHLANRQVDWQSFIDWLSGTTSQFSDLGQGTGGAFAQAFLDALTQAGLDLGTLFGLANSGLPPFDKPGRSKGSATGWSGFQSGGIVPGPRGRARLVVAHGHEAILTDRHQRMLARQLFGSAPTVDPRDLPPMTSGGRAGGGGVTVQVIGGTFLGRDEATGRAIARLVEPHIKRRIIGFTTYNG